jgi:hypothetical protein
MNGFGRTVLNSDRRFSYEEVSMLLTLAKET